MKKESRRSKEKKRKERNKGPNSIYLHNFFFLLFSHYFREIVIW